MNMPTRDRKYYISRHNEVTDSENEEYESENKGGSTKTEASDRFTDVTQSNLKNAKNR